MPDCPLSVNRALIAAVLDECNRARHLVADVGPALRRQQRDARLRAALLRQEVRWQRQQRELEAIAIEALRDEEIVIGVAWARRFGPIETDEQFAAIVRTTRLGLARRAGGATPG